MTATVLALALLASPAQDDKSLLRWTFRQGDLHRYRTTERTVMDYAGTEVVRERSVTVALSVDSVDADGTGSLRIRYDAVAMRASGGTEYDYDSRKDEQPPDDPGVRLHARLVGHAFTMKMAPDGRVREIGGLDRLLLKLLEGEPPEVRARAKRAAKDGLSAEAMASMMQRLSPPLPRDPVGPGDRWSHEHPLELPGYGRAALRVASHLESFEAGRARMGQTLSFDPLAAPEREPGAAELVSLRGKATNVFSAARGILLSAETSLEIVLNVGGGDLPMKVRQVVTRVE